MDEDPSIVEYFAEHEGYRCGYCKSKDTNFSHGMWAHQMHVQDYQDLIDRGWRRSGKYCYKPTLNRTCCPMYTIKCNAVDFKLSKSQKKVLKRVNRYLITGKHDGLDDKKDGNEESDSIDDRMSGEGDVKSMESMMADKVKPSSIDLPSGHQGKKSESEETKSCAIKERQEGSASMANANNKVCDEMSSAEKQATVKRQPPRAGTGPDPSKPVCRKAKELRAERRQQKLSAKPQNARSQVSATKLTNSPKTLEELINEPQQAPHCAHKLELRLVRSSPKSSEFESTFTATHRVYHRYQTSIHKDPPSKPSQSQFTRFLCDSPLGELYQDGGPSMGFGSFHQQYLLDGQLIAVGVVDILPTCVSSVYLYYDPSYAFLSLGVYSALREIAFVRELARSTPDLHFYYMGFYIHSCGKMRYKGQYSPSFLACPETYKWVSIDKCRPKLDQSKYSRFEEDGVEDQDKMEDISTVLVLHKRTAMPYALYKNLNKGESSKDDGAEVKEYAGFVGRTCATRMLLVRS